MYSTPRQHNRHVVVAQVTLRVHSGGASVSMSGQSSNLSHGGMFVQVKTSLCAGCGVEVEIATADGQRPIVTRGVVVHAIKGEGVGVRFTEVSDEVQEALRDLIGPAEEQRSESTIPSVPRG